MANLSSIMANPHYVTFQAVAGNQFGKQVITMQCSAEQVLKFIEIDRDVQRDLIDYHVTEIQKYIQTSLEGGDIYFPPLIFSSRGRGTYDDRTLSFHMGMTDKLVVLDGQHRIKAFEMVIGRLKTREDEKSKAALAQVRNFPMTIQIFTDLTMEQEQQLFTDVNTKASKVSNTLLVMYKGNNLCANLAKEIIGTHPSISEEKFEVRSKTTRTKLMTAATLHNTIVTLNEGVFYTAMARSSITEKNYAQYKERTEEFLQLLMKYAPDGALNRQDYMIFVPSVITGIAQFVYRSLKEEPRRNMESLFEEVIRQVDWSHKNKDLRQRGIPFKQTTKRYNFSNGARGSKIISAYLKEQLKGNR